ncbi:MAG: PPOX class F420-dependent oxidoreductase [Thermoleophilia bacterium]|nr:PPOX class F420-dependent oxidoreductase [Thermoleophilia bacterium]
MRHLPDEVRELIDGPNYCHLATLMPDGAPHVVAVWAGMEGPHVAVFTQRGSRKARNIARDPRVSLSVTGHADPYRTAHLRGRVVGERTGDEALAVMDRLSLTYTGEPFPMRGPDGVLLLIEPEHVGFRALPFTHRA